MFVQESKKVYANVCFQRFAVGWVKPYNIAFSIFANVVNNKRLYKFLQFDIKDFYPSIKETISNKAIQFAKEHVAITRNEVEVIFHARKSVLYNDGEPWMKEGGSFDVTMRAPDGAEVCAEVCAFICYI